MNFQNIFYKMENEVIEDYAIEVRSRQNLSEPRYCCSLTNIQMQVNFFLIYINVCKFLFKYIRRL